MSQKCSKSTENTTKTSSPADLPWRSMLKKTYSPESSRCCSSAIRSSSLGEVGVRWKEGEEEGEGEAPEGEGGPTDHDDPGLLHGPGEERPVGPRLPRLPVEGVGGHVWVALLAAQSVTDLPGVILHGCRGVGKNKTGQN